MLKFETGGGSVGFFAGDTEPRGLVVSWQGNTRPEYTRAHLDNGEALKLFAWLGSWAPPDAPDDRFMAGVRLERARSEALTAELREAAALLGRFSSDPDVAAFLDRVTV